MLQSVARAHARTHTHTTAHKVAGHWKNFHGKWNWRRMGFPRSANC